MRIAFMVKFFALCLVVIGLASCDSAEYYTGLIDITSSPSDAVVKVNDHIIGRTPLHTTGQSLNRLIPYAQPFNLVVEKSFYQTIHRSAVIAKTDKSWETEIVLLPGIEDYRGDLKYGARLGFMDLVKKNQSELHLLRNEIFARYGRQFTTPEIAAYFAAKSWYKVNPDYSDNFLTDTDKANSDMIAALEMPFPDPATVQATVLRNIQYTDGVLTITFSNQAVLLANQSLDGQAKDDSPYQGVFNEGEYSWFPFRNWIIAYNERGLSENRAVALRLNHRALTVETIETLIIDRKSLIELRP